MQVLLYNYPKKKKNRASILSSTIETIVSRTHDTTKYDYLSYIIMKCRDMSAHSESSHKHPQTVTKMIKREKRRRGK